MQFFADLEGYLANTRPEELKLDFYDMRYLESAAFKKLRQKLNKFYRNEEHAY